MILTRVSSSQSANWINSNLVCFRTNRALPSKRYYISDISSLKISHNDFISTVLFSICMTKGKICQWQCMPENNGETFKCACPDGFMLIGNTCTDINECNCKWTFYPNILPVYLTVKWTLAMRITYVSTIMAVWHVKKRPLVPPASLQSKDGKMNSKEQNKVSSKNIEHAMILITRFISQFDWLFDRRLGFIVLGPHYFLHYHDGHLDKALFH